MRFHLLDVVVAGTAAGEITATFLIILLVTILTEAVIMLLMKYNRFAKTLPDSFIVNAGSVTAGFIMIKSGSRLFDNYFILDILVLFMISTVIEFGILYLLNRNTSPAKTFMVALVMNLVTYILFYLINTFVIS